MNYKQRLLAKAKIFVELKKERYGRADVALTEAQIQELYQLALAIFNQGESASTKD